MAVRVRASGEVLCAAMNPALPGDFYIDDGWHYWLSVEAKLLVTEPWKLHEQHGGRWWWAADPARPATIDPFYLRA